MPTNSNEIFFNFTYYALKLLGKNLYSSPWSAISELVANGLDAGAKNIYVLIDMLNKQESKIEIFDDGSGMTYEDLRDKYTLIGRNKREEVYGDEKSKMLGRKGIGKLAALYLSKNYFLSTKTENAETTWVVNALKYKDDDRPSMIKVDNCDFLASSIWNKFKSGTMIELCNVNLKNIGEEKIKSLKAILSDYYLYDKINGKIHVCVLDKKNRKIIFEQVEKKVYFSTMYGIFDNSNSLYYKKLKDKVYLTKPLIPEKLDIPRDTVIYTQKDFENLVSGTLDIINEKGDVSRKKYELTGWIGIHSSIEEEIEKRNDINYKKLVYRGNSLRLYVRNKLAVDNFIKYLGSTQALASYIEGEISFDILDDDDLEDISTSNREGYPINDIRIQKLIEITTQIVRTLMNKRSNIGSKINREVEEFRKQEKYEALLRERKAFEIAKQEKRARELAENKTREINETLHQQKKENEKIKYRLFNLESNFTKDGESYKHGMHLAVNFAKEIRGDIADIYNSEISNEQINEQIMEIDRVAEKIERLPNTIERSSFSLNSPYIKENLIEYVEQYLEIRNSKSLEIKVEKLINKYVLEFDFSDIVMLIENIISNAKKASASIINVKIYNKDGYLIFDFINNGVGLDAKYSKDPELVFNLGESSTNGYGIGCYHIKKIIDLMGGNVSIFNNTDEKGVTYRVVLGDGKV